MADRSRVILCTVGAPHGVSGKVRVRSYTQDPLAIADYGPLFDIDGRRFDIVDARISKTVVVVAFKQINTREAAEALNGVELGVARDQLPDDILEDDEFYIEDLIGLDCIDEAGALIAKVVAVHNFGADDIVEVRFFANGKTDMLPFTHAVFPKIDFASGQLTLVSPGEVVARESDEDEDGAHA